MTPRNTQTHRVSEAGTVAIEYAYLLPVLVALFLGTMDVSRFIWTNVTLHRAVEAAARCGGINVCQDDAAIKAQAVAEAWGLTVTPGVFTVVSEATSVTVTANYDFTILVPFLGDVLTQGQHHITASARYPRKP